MLELKDGLEENESENMEKTENVSQAQESNEQQSPASDKYPAPSTPQLKQGERLLDDGDCQDHINCLIEKESVEQEGDSKSVETTCAMSEETLQAGDPQSFTETVIKEEDDSTDGVKSENNMCPNSQNKDTLNHSNGRAEKASSLHNSHGTRANRKKMKVDWTPELHRKFVQAVEKLGVDQAIPSRILEVMKVEGLTRHNVASHLQKYRMHRRHILPKEDERRWTQHRDQVQRSYYPHKPIMAYPPYHSNHALPPGPVYPMWGATGSHTAGVHMWGPPGYSPWPPTESCHWKPYPGMHADAWGCPVMPPHGPYSSIPHYASGFQSASMVNNSCGMPQKLFDLQPAEEVIDKVVKEAINKPWLPLPLGLKPPSALIDFVPTISGLSLADAPAFKKAPGGAPANVAVGIARLGGSSAFIGKVGEDEFGYMLAEILKENNVNSEGMRFDPGARTALAFVTLRSDGEREFMFYRNPSADMLLQEAELDLDLIRKAKIFHYGSISLITEPCKSAHIAAAKAAKDAGVVLSYDPNLRLPLWPSAESAREGILSIWDTADIIKISEEEISFLTKGEDPYDDAVVRKLCHPNHKLLLVTEGPEGCRYYTKEFNGRVKGLKVDAVDTTGAGDAFVAGILSQLAKDLSLLQNEDRLREALMFANACGALTVKERGAIPALPTKEAVHNAILHSVG